MFFPGALGTLIEIEQLEGYKKSYIKFQYYQNFLIETYQN